MNRHSFLTCLLHSVFAVKMCQGVMIVKCVGSGALPTVNNNTAVTLPAVPVLSFSLLILKVPSWTVDVWSCFCCDPVVLGMGILPLAEFAKLCFVLDVLLG